MNHSAISVDADMTIRAGATEGHLGGSGSRLTFSTSDLAPFLSSIPDGGRSRLRGVSDQLGALGVRIHVVEDGVGIVDLGDVRPSLMARVLGLGKVRVRRPFLLMARYVRR